VQVHDHRAGVAALVEQIVDCRECLDGPLQRPDEESRAAGEDESSRRCPRAEEERATSQSRNQNAESIAIPALMRR